MCGSLRLLKVVKENLAGVDVFGAPVSGGAGRQRVLLAHQDTVHVGTSTGLSTIRLRVDMF